jgi:hypothetical protein
MDNELIMLQGMMKRSRLGHPTSRRKEGVRNNKEDEEEEMMMMMMMTTTA